MKTKEQLVSLGLTEIKADEVMLLESKMLEQAVRFQFRKKSGEVRDAVGTRNLEMMIQEDGKRYEFKTAGKPECPTTMGYWDLEKKAWRSFVLTSFIGLVKA
jgi:hypothetical protein